MGRCDRSGNAVNTGMLRDGGNKELPKGISGTRISRSIASFFTFHLDVSLKDLPVATVKSNVNESTPLDSWLWLTRGTASS